MNRIAATLIAICSVLQVFGQDTISVLKNHSAVLDVIRVVKVRYNDYAIRTDQADSTQSRIQESGTVADLFGGNVLNTKAYAPGGLATTGVRGANSMQTPVFWNGISLQNVTNNTVDLSLLPVFLFDRITIRPGGSSAAWGNGAIGGAVDLQMHAIQYDHHGNEIIGDFLKHKIVSEVGGFGTMRYGIQTSGARKRFTYDLKAYRQQADNDYQFYNRSMIGWPLDTLKHAGYYQQGVMAEIGYKSKTSSNIFSGALWWQETFRHLPAAMFTDTSTETQQDYALRALATWLHRFKNPDFHLLTKAAFIHEGLLYNPGYGTIVNNTDAMTYILQSDLFFLPNGNGFFGRRVSYQFSANNTYYTAEVTDAIVKTGQNRLALFGTITKYFRNEDALAFSFREEMIDEDLIEPVGSISYYTLLREWLGIKTNVAHSYRVPTFNDLYWTPGGNRDLQSERAWTEEITLEFHLRRRTIFGGLYWNADYSVTAYNRNVYNMIQWTPSASYWSPHNIGEVWSRGVEHRLKLVVKNSSVRFTLLGTADYIRSTAEETAIVNDPALHKQLIYVPAWFGSTMLSIDWKDWYLSGSWQYTDLRFTTRDHTEYLPSYQLVNAAIGKQFRLSNAKHSYMGNIFFRANNILDAQYESVSWRPMPGRNFSLGISVSMISREKQPTKTDTITID
jgi:iron complex outermembrane receptor protein